MALDSHSSSEGRIHTKYTYDKLKYVLSMINYIRYFAL